MKNRFLLFSVSKSIGWRAQCRTRIFIAGDGECSIFNDVIASLYQNLNSRYYEFTITNEDVNNGVLLKHRKMEYRRMCCVCTPLRSPQLLCVRPRVLWHSDSICQYIELTATGESMFSIWISRFVSAMHANSEFVRIELVCTHRVDVCAQTEPSNSLRRRQQSSRSKW